MEALLWLIEGVASCKHHTPEQLRLPFHTAKGSQSTIHKMLMKNMVELCRSPASATFSPLISFIRKTQHILQVLSDPLSQLGATAKLVGNQRRTRCAVLKMYSSHWGADACVSDVANRGAGW